MITPHALAKLVESTKIDSSKLCSKLSESANQVVFFLESKLQRTGSYGDEAKDIACYFKSPMMFLAANKQHTAATVLDYIKSAFMCEDGDFKTIESMKSTNPAYIEYWSYTNGWIVRAANLLGSKEISERGYKYLSQYNANNGFLTNQIGTKSQVTDVLTAAHHGLMNLEFDNLDVAISAGKYLCDVIKKQSDLKKGFYLRLDKQGGLLTEFSKEQAPFCFVSVTEPDQLHFMIGYPAAYLAILYKRTKDLNFLNAAKTYLDFSLSCDQSVYSSNFSHKLAWAASHIYECTGEDKYLEVIDKISNYFIAKQKNGMWFLDDINVSYDQSAEIACWFLECVKNINGFKKKDYLEQEKQVGFSHKSYAIKAVKYGAIALVAGIGLFSFLRPRLDAPATCDAGVDMVIRLNRIG